MSKKISRKLKNGKEEFTPKRKAFVEEYIKNGGNGTQAALKVYNTNSSNTANQIALDNLQKPTVISALDKALVKANLTEDNVARIHARNLFQEDNLKVSQTAIKDYYSIKGYTKKDTDNKNVNVAFIINN